MRTHTSCMSYNRIKKINVEIFSHSWFGCIAYVMLEWHILWEYCTDFDGSHMVCSFFRVFFSPDSCPIVYLYLYMCTLYSTKSKLPQMHRCYFNGQIKYELCCTNGACVKGKTNCSDVLNSGWIAAAAVDQYPHILHKYTSKFTYNECAPDKIYTIHTNVKACFIWRKHFNKICNNKAVGTHKRTGEGRVRERGNICLNSIHTVAINQNACAHTTQHW